MTAATTHKHRRNGFPRGSAHPGSLYTAEQMAKAKRMLIEAEREVRFAPGEYDRIAQACGISRVAVLTLAHGEAWSWLKPAPATNNQPDQKGSHHDL